MFVLEALLEEKVEEDFAEELETTLAAAQDFAS